MLIYSLNKMRHLFFVSLLKAREKQIADGTDFERMISASSEEEMNRVLHDTDYGPYVSESSSFDHILESEKAGRRVSFLHMGMDDDVIRLIFLSADVFNMRVLLKKRKFGTVLRIHPFGGDKDYLQEKYTHIFKEAEKISSPEEMDNMLTEFMFEEMDRLSKEDVLLNRFVNSYKEKSLSVESTNADLLEEEDRFLSESKSINEGLSPIFAHIMRKNRAERVMRAIYEAKKVQIPKEKIYKIIKEVPAL